MQMMRMRRRRAGGGTGGESKRGGITRTFPFSALEDIRERVDGEAEGAGADEGKNPDGNGDATTQGERNEEEGTTNNTNKATKAKKDENNESEKREKTRNKQARIQVTTHLNVTDTPHKTEKGIDTKKKERRKSFHRRYHSSIPVLTHTLSLPSPPSPDSD